MVKVHLKEARQREAVFLHYQKKLTSCNFVARSRHVAPACSVLEDISNLAAYYSAIEVTAKVQVFWSHACRGAGRCPAMECIANRAWECAMKGLNRKSCCRPHAG